MVWRCAYLLYVDEKVIVLKLRKAQGSKSDNQAKIVLQKLSECLCDKKCIWNKDRKYVIIMHQQGPTGQSKRIKKSLVETRNLFWKVGRKNYARLVNIRDKKCDVPVQKEGCTGRLKNKIVL